MKTLKFNINHIMYIQITDEGWAHIRKTRREDYITHSILPYKVMIDGKEWYKLQCWQAFELLPPNFGGQPRFYTNVMFEDKDLHE